MFVTPESKTGAATAYCPSVHRGHGECGGVIPLDPGAIPGQAASEGLAGIHFFVTAPDPLGMFATLIPCQPTHKG